MTTEMGKTLAAARAEAAKCAKAMRWYAAHAERLLADEHPDPADVEDSGAHRAYVRYRPLGVVLAVMPWNFPLWQVVRFAAPALMAGNIGLLKHASNVPQTALYLGDLFRRAGFPAGCFQTLLVGSGAVEDVLRDPPGGRRDPDRQRGRGPRGGRRRRGRGQADGAGARRQRPVRGDAVRRRGAGPRGGHRRHRPGAEQRPVLHRRQALHRARRTSTTTSPSASPAPWTRWWSATRCPTRTDIGPLSTEQGRADLEELVDGRGRPGRAGALRRRPPRGADGGLVLPADRARRRHRADAHPPGGGVRPGRHPLPGARTSTRPSRSPTTRRSG